jgi:hypothetical protein
VSDEGEPPVFGGQGFQLGTGNTQRNYFGPKSPLDAASLSVLSPSTRVARIRQQRHDDVVDFFAGAAPQDAVKIGFLSELVRADDAMVVSVLADIDPAKAAALISLCAPELRELPTAAQAIERRAAALRWHLDGGVGRLERGRRTYRRRYEKGTIFWHPRGGVHAVSPRFMECYQPAEYGYPVTDYADGVQGFQTGAIFLAGQQVLGASGGIYRKWGYSRFGPPVAAREDFNGVSRQRFTGGIIFATEQGVFEVKSAVAGQVDRQIPVEDEVEVESGANAGIKGVAQSFRAQVRRSSAGGILVAGRRFPRLPRGEVLVCSAPTCGTQRVSGPILRYYRRLGGPTSWLGFPTSDVLTDGTLQYFEGGVICHRKGVTVGLSRWAFPFRHVILWWKALVNG